MSEQIKKTIASANINFLIGAGASSPFLKVLGDIERQLSEAKTPAEEQELKEEYFNDSIAGNLKLFETPITDGADTLNSYKEFYKIINQIVLKRESSLLSKQVNIFTTNIDIFSEMALEQTGIEFNDGFHGRFNPKYDIGNFKKSYYKTSLHYENISQIPVFNILKLHGSVSWKKDDENNSIVLDKDLSTTKEIADDFDNFDKLMIVNPTEKKFEDTTLNQTFYDLLRIYANELEKENSVLFVFGFSFSDQHIKDMTLRVANTNPTLKIYIINYDRIKTEEYESLENTKNKNVEIIMPEEGENYDYKNLNKLLESLLREEKKDD